MSIQESIITVINSRGLSESDIDAIVVIVGERCRHKTKERLRSILTYGASTIPNYGIMGRLIWDGKRWEYIAGQYCTGEIKTLRECILKG